MELGTKVTGGKINNTVMDSKLGPMVLHTKVLMLMARSMVMVVLHGLMEALTMVNS
jgi:hypothetical protein